MRQNQFFIVILLLIGCCLISFKAQEDVFKLECFEFEFDEIDYYRHNAEGLERYTLIVKTMYRRTRDNTRAIKYSEAELDSIKQDAELGYVLTDNSLRSSKDTVIVSRFESLGFTKYSVEPFLNDTIYSLLHDYRGMKYESYCTPLYRDILVFKERGVIVAIAKICFGCEVFILFRPIENPPVYYDTSIYFESLKKILHSID